MTSRGMAFGDLFNDGHIDVVVNNMDAAPALLRNVSAPAAGGTMNHWIEFHLVGGPKSPRDAIGATMYVTAGGIKQREDVYSGGSFESTSDMRPHFGLGAAVTIDAIEVHWPSGAVEQFSVSGVDRIVTLAEGKGVRVAAHGPAGATAGNVAGSLP
jgi:hypothetical protein